MIMELKLEKVSATVDTANTQMYTKQQKHRHSDKSEYESRQKNYRLQMVNCIM